jgi:drug/metabolite transporter (DMT)-like permease
MLNNNLKKPSQILVILAFATVYIVWGSTYFFIQKALQDIPPMMLGAFRFIMAGGLLMGWCMIKGEGIGNWRQIKPAIISGLLLLLGGTGAVIWAEKSLPSSLVAVLISSAPFWFILLDRPRWKENLKNRSVILGLTLGFIGVTTMFSEKVFGAILSSNNLNEIIPIFIILFGTVSWAAGSLYSKHFSSGSTTVNSAWQMLAAGTAFIAGSLVLGEWNGFQWGTVSSGSWFSVIFLVVMGSLAAYSAYVWLLQKKSAAQVSTYAYVNPVIAVMLGVFFAGEHMSLIQVGGLVIILISVLLINLSNYLTDRKNQSR